MNDVVHKPTCRAHAGERRRVRVVELSRRLSVVLLLALCMLNCHRSDHDTEPVDEHTDAIHDWCDGSESCNSGAFSARFSSHSACVARQQSEARVNAEFYADYGPDCHAAHAAATRCTLESATCTHDGGVPQFVPNIDACADVFETFSANCSRQ